MCLILVGYCEGMRETIVCFFSFCQSVLYVLANFTKIDGGAVFLKTYTLSKLRKWWFGGGRREKNDVVHTMAGLVQGLWFFSLPCNLSDCVRWAANLHTH